MSVASLQMGSNCDGWVLAEEKGLSVKHERMQAGAEESLHYHQHAQQFFFMLKGNAAFEVDEKIIMVNEGEGILIRPGKIHRVMNKSKEAIEFILCSQPSVEDDRFNCV